jgi:phytoene synthase
LLALAAFSAEIRRIPGLVREPAMGEIRRQWWRDALTLPAELRSGHPIADAARGAVRAYHLPPDLLVRFIDGAPSHAPGDPPLDDQRLTRSAGAEGALFELASRVLGLPPGVETTAGCAAAGNAYGLARLLLDLPRALAAGRIAASSTPPAPGSELDAPGSEAGSMEVEALLGEYAARSRQSVAIAREFAAGLPHPARVAFLPLALVEPYLRALEGSGARFLQEGADVAPLTRVWRIAAAHLWGRL